MKRVISQSVLAQGCEVCDLTYKDVLQMLKRALARNDAETVRKLQRSQYYDDAVETIQYAMQGKRIHAATILASETSDVFDVTTTGASYYDNFLNEKDLKYMQDAKNMTGSIEMITPAEYYKTCSEDIFDGRSSVDDLKEQREYSKDPDTGERLVDEYEAAMKQGDKFPLCYLNYASSNQEGLHRMYAAGEAFGWDVKFPVLVIRPYDMDRYNKQRQNEAINDYQRYSLENVVKDAVDEVSDWDAPVPDNVVEIVKEAVERCAESYEDDPHTIEVDVEREDEDHLNVCLTKFDGIDVELCRPISLWLDDMYKTTEDTEGPDDLDDIDDNLDDLDISDLLFL